MTGCYSLSVVTLEPLFAVVAEVVLLSLGISVSRAVAATESFRKKPKYLHLRVVAFVSYRVPPHGDKVASCRTW